MIALCVGVKYESAILKTRECATIGYIAMEHHVKGLLPERCRFLVDRLLLAPIHEGQEPTGVGQIEWAFILIDPEDIMERGTAKAGQCTQRFSQEVWDLTVPLPEPIIQQFPLIFQHIGVQDTTGWKGAIQNLVGYWFIPRILNVQPS